MGPRRPCRAALGCRCRPTRVVVQAGIPCGRTYELRRQDAVRDACGAVLSAGAVSRRPTARVRRWLGRQQAHALQSKPERLRSSSARRNSPPSRPVLFAQWRHRRVLLGLQRRDATGPPLGRGPTRLLAAEDLQGASWAEDGTIVFSASWGQPLRIRRRGSSETTILTRINREAGEHAHLWPQILPSNRAALFTIWTAAPTWDEAQLAVANLETGQHAVVLRGGTYGRYAASGHLVFWRGHALWAAPFDLKTLTLSGEPVRVVEDVRLDVNNGSAHFTLSDSGTLAYVKGGVDTFAECFLADRAGKQVGRFDQTESAGVPRFSPDGKRLALTLFRGGAYGIGVYDLERRLLTPLPLTGDNGFPSWTREGDRITFMSNAGGAYNYYSIAFD